MLFLLGLIIRALARLLVGPRAGNGSKDLEILVLRHQLRVLPRKTGPPKLRAIDRVLLGRGQSVDPARPMVLLSGHAGDARPLALIHESGGVAA